MSTTRRATAATLAAGALTAALAATAPSAGAAPRPGASASPSATSATPAATAKPTAKPAKKAVKKAPACPKVTWGSVEKEIQPGSPAVSSAAATVRTGHHPCFDRVVYEVSGEVGPTVVLYDPVVLAKGQRALLVTSLTGLPKPTMKPVVTGMPSAVGLIGVRETSDPRIKATGIVTRATLPFRAFFLKGPGAHNRIVVDVVHRW